MTTAAPVTCRPGDAPDVTVRLDAEKLDCHRLAVEAQAFAAALLTPEHRVLRDQPERASLSVVLNISRLDAALA